MGQIVNWIAAEAERVDVPIVRRRERVSREEIVDLPAYSFAGYQSTALTTGGTEEHRENQNPEVEDLSPGLTWEEERARRRYRGQTVWMLRRYMRYSMETGRMPSILGREFFRAKVSWRSAVTFEDRVIFVHDVETCLGKLDEFSRELIARHILQEHDLDATARLLGCGKRTVCRYAPIALDLLAEILLDVGLLERRFPVWEKSCQGGKSNESFVSGSQESKNKF